MKLSALILTGALSLNLGVMTVAAQAHQQGQVPPGRNPTTSTGPTIPDPESGAAMGRPGGPGGPGGCILLPGVPGGSGNPCAIGASGQKTAEDLAIYILLDRANTVRACTTRGGEVVRREGVQQCRIPALAAPPLGNPGPGGIPPRN